MSQRRGRPAMPPGTYGTVSVRRTSDRRYRADVRARRLDGRVVRHRAVRRTRHAAQAAAVAWAADQAQRMGQTAGAVITPDSTVPEMVAAYLDARTDLAAGSVSTYRAALRQHIEPGLGALTLRTVTVPALDIWLRGLSPGTWDTSRKLLSGAWRWAVRQGVATENPAAATTPPPTQQTAPTALSRAAVVALIRAARSYSVDPSIPGPQPRSAWVAPWVLFMVGSGVRVAEAQNVRWGDVTGIPGTGPVTVFIAGTKTRGSRRCVALPDFAAAALRQQYEACPPDPADPGSSYVWRARATSVTPITTANVRTRLRQVRDYAKSRNLPCPDISPKDLRSTAATWAQRGADTDAASALLGHSGPAVTGRHYLAAPEVVAGHVAALEATWTE